MRWGRAGSAAVLAVTLAACGTGGARPSSESVREAVGSCSLKAGQSSDVVPAAARFQRDLRWVEAQDLVKVSDPPAGSRRSRVRLVAATPLDDRQVATAADEVVGLYAPYLTHAGKARDAGRRFVAGIAESGEIYILAGVDAAGDVAFVGDCQYRYMTTPFDRYVAAKGAGRTPADVLRAIATSGERAAFIQFLAPKPVPGWDDLPPSQRQIDEQSTPRSVLATLQHVRLAYGLPESWRSHGDIGVCSRLSIGWGECTMIADGGPPREPIPFQSYAMAGEAIELWAVNERGDIDAPLRRLGILPADAVARAVSGKRTLVIVPAPGIETYEQFRAALAAGEITLVLAEVR